MELDELLDYHEYYDFFFNDLHSLISDSECLGKMLEDRISTILKDIEKKELNEEMCIRTKGDIHRVIDVYSRMLEAYCVKLKITYTQSFEKIKHRIDQDRKKCEIHSINDQ